MTPAERRLAGRIGAYAMHARHDVRETSKPGREAAWAKLLREVDPDGVLPPAERERRAEAARRAHMSAIALRSVQARARRRGGRPIRPELEQPVDESDLALVGDPGQAEPQDADPQIGVLALDEERVELGLERVLVDRPPGHAVKRTPSADRSAGPITPHDRARATDTARARIPSIRRAAATRSTAIARRAGG